jgi:GWxTD domain-containing protein
VTRAGIALVLAVAVSACSGGLMSTGERDGWTRAFEEGVPAFDLEVIPVGDSNQAEVRLGLIPASLVFSAMPDGGYRARVHYTVEIGDALVSEYTDSLVAVSVETASSFERVVRTRTVSMDSEARVRVVLRDLSSERSATRVQAVTWTEAEGASIGRVHLKGLEQPLVGIDIARDAPTLTAGLTVRAWAPGCVSWTFVSVPTDTLAASLPFSLSPPFGSRAYAGALYDSADTLAVSDQRVDAPGGLTVNWELPEQRSLGVHRVTASWSADCDAPGVSTGRSFIVRPAGFPRVVSLDVMIEALDYIASEDELARVEAATGAADRKDAFDAFWGRALGEPVSASRALARYYSRVEEANRAFSGFKEGWKTDRGMIYIVMGPPLYQEDSMDELRWFYSYDERNAGRYFVFDRVQGYPDELEMPHYVLRRSMEQEQEWRLAVRRWRSGRAR